MNRVRQVVQFRDVTPRIILLTTTQASNKKTPAPNPRNYLKGKRAITRKWSKLLKATRIPFVISPIIKPHLRATSIESISLVSVLTEVFVPVTIEMYVGQTLIVENCRYALASISFQEENGNLLKESLLYLLHGTSCLSHSFI